MHKDEAEKIELALDGIMANLETLRTVIRHLCDEVASDGLTEPNTDMSSGDSNTCSHENIRQIETMGGIQTYCFDCDHAE